MTLTEEQQGANFERLRYVLKHQLDVRACKIGGMVETIEHDIFSCYLMGLITGNQLDDLEQIAGYEFKSYYKD